VWKNASVKSLTWFAVASVAAGSLLPLSLRVDAQKNAGEPLPVWAWPLPPTGTPAAPAAVLTNEVKHVPGSAASYTDKEIPSLFLVPDWFPNEHPKMPKVVAEGRAPGVNACGHCHLPTGMGRPENMSVAGLSKGYMMEQMADFRDGLRKSSDPRFGSTTHMIQTVQHATPEEIEEGVDYFASLKPKKWIRVVETDRVPLTQVGALMMVVDDAKKTEPIGGRVLEVPEDLEQTELRNPHSGFVAYVPVGTLKKGEALTQTCVVCHGADLRGVGDVPSIAGRSPSQMTRQLIDFKTGARNGKKAVLMKPVVQGMTVSQMVSITGYLASLQP
jgi:cytochrome c553